MERREREWVVNSTTSLRAAALALTILFVPTVFATQAIEAQTLQVIHSFANAGDGRNPFAGLTLDGAGNLYGTAVNGGRGCGTVFQLKQKGSGWTFNPLYSFVVSSDGCDPEATAIFGPNGTLFGTTHAGGEAGYGTVFNLRPFPTACQAALCPWMETVLYNFAGAADGGSPGYGDLSTRRVTFMAPRTWAASKTASATPSKARPAVLFIS